MEVYDLKGFIVEGTIAVIAISLPKEQNGNKYSIKVKGKITESGVIKLRINFRDIECEDLTIPNNTNFVTQIIDLSSFGYKLTELTNPVEVVFYHIKGKPDPKEAVIKVGTGTIKP